jgi:cysteine desulfurase
VPVYLDNMATTPLGEGVAEAMAPYFGNTYGNASSIHRMGNQAALAIEKARAIIAKELNAEAEEIHFTSGGTEANNWALKGMAWAGNMRGKHLIISAIEHPSIYRPARWLEKRGFRLSILPVDKKGFVDPAVLEKEICKDTFLVSIIHANNESGTMQNLADLGQICRNKGVVFHSDACQSFTKKPIDVKQLPVDMLCINAHKLHGPKGIGALYIRKGTAIEALLHGGGQESGLRSGTLNTPAIVGFGKAVELSNESDIRRMTVLRDQLIGQLKNIWPEAELIGPAGDKRLCNNICMAFHGLDGKELFKKLNKKDIYVSTGSACASASKTPSRVLMAMGHSPETSHASLRISINRETDKKDIDVFLKEFITIVKQLK